MRFFSGRPVRAQEKLRLKKLPRRRDKLSALRRATPSTVSLLRRTGLMPAGSHGAGVSGLADSTLGTIRAMAGTLVGAKRSGSLTAWLATQPDPFYDPIFDAT
eukprot:4270130-Pyramimonas_sp.AAC.1